MVHDWKFYNANWSGSLDNILPVNWLGIQICCFNLERSVPRTKFELDLSERHPGSFHIRLKGFKTKLNKKSLYTYLSVMEHIVWDSIW